MFPVPMSVPPSNTTQAQFARVATPENPFRFTCGAEMDDLTLAYETYGSLNADKTNAMRQLGTFSKKVGGFHYGKPVEIEK